MGDDAPAVVPAPEPPEHVYRLPDGAIMLVAPGTDGPAELDLLADVLHGALPHLGGTAGR